MKKVFVLLFFIVNLILAKENFSQMSNQELIEIIGFVDEKDMASFQKEIELRLKKMNNNEKAQYEKRLFEIPESKPIEEEAEK